MMDFLRRHLPGPVKRVLGRVYYPVRRFGRKAGAFFRRKRRERRQTWDQFRKGVRITRRERRQAWDQFRKGVRTTKRERRHARDRVRKYGWTTRREHGQRAEAPVPAPAATATPAPAPAPRIRKTAPVIEGRTRRERRRRAADLKGRLKEARAGLEQARREARRLRGDVQRLSRLSADMRQRLSDPDEEWNEQRVAITGGRTRERDLAYFPGGAQNPYLRMLYSRCIEEGWEARPLSNYSHIDQMDESSVFHLHWTRVFQAGAESEEGARAQTAARLRRIEDYLGRGGHLLWSVHEWLPHDCEFPDVEVELRNRLVELATAVHVLHGSTIDEVAGLYPLDPAKTFVVDHPLYTGVYPDYVARDAARRLLGVDDDEVLLVGFGAIRPYKGFDRLARAVPRLRAETGLRVRAIIAGPTYKTIDNQDLVDLVEATEGVSMSGRPVPDAHVQVLFRAADVVVLPYRKVLNSGVLMLALTFGCRSVAPENPVTADLVGSGLVHLFDETSDDDLDRAITEAISRRTERGALSAAFLDRYDHLAVAGQFAREVNRIITGGTAGRPPRAP